jgi:hypothetical protein
LYILLGLEEFYFPNSSSNVQTWYFKYLDDLDSIGKYSWGLAVYETLALSLNEGGQKLRKRKNSAQLHIRGCVVVLQVYLFMNHNLSEVELNIFWSIEFYLYSFGGFTYVGMGFRTCLGAAKKKYKHSDDVSKNVQDI